MAVSLAIAPAAAADGPSLQQQLQRADELEKAGELGEALKTLESLLAQAETARDPGAFAGVLTLRIMRLQIAQSDFPAAEATAKRAFELAEGLLGQRQPMWATLSKQVAMEATTLYLRRGRPAQAELWAQREVAAAEKFDRNGDGHAGALDSLARVEKTIGKYAQAQQHLEQVIAIAGKASKRDLAREASILMRLGALRGLRGDASGAREAYGQALERELARGDDPADAWRLQRARLLRALGREADAVAALDRAYAVAHAAADAAPMGPSTSPQELAKRRAAYASWRHVATIERDRGQVESAETALRRAMALSESLDIRDKPSLQLMQIGMQIELGELLRARAAWSDAEAVYAEALAGLDRNPGGTARDLPDVLEGLARSLLAKGDLKRAEAAVRREINLYETYIASDHPKLASALELLTEILVASGRGDEAKPVLARAVAIKEVKR
jgi:tetratricopeptide (TPR) repeat protein